MLARRGVVVYVGQSKCILKRVYSHETTKTKQRSKTPLLFGNKPMAGIVFDEVYICLCSVAELDDLEREMIVQYAPKFNIRLKDRPTVPRDLSNIVSQIMTHRRIASPSAEPRPQIDRRGR